MQFDIEKEDIGALERARKALYNPSSRVDRRTPLSAAGEHSLPHAWTDPMPAHAIEQGKRHVRLASVFLGGAAAFFLVSLAAAGYFFYFGSNSVSPDKVALDIVGPTTIAGGDTVPLSITITNKNPVALANATIEIDFPDGTRSATNVLAPYPRYVENLGTLPSGATVTRSIKAVVFGGAGQALTLPASLSYGTASSNAVFQKSSSYALAITSTPLSVSVDSLAETISGEPLTFTLSVRSNATVPLSNVVLTTSAPFGFAVTSSSVPMTNGSFFIGTLAPGATRQVTLTGALTGQNNEQRVFHFTVGTAKSSLDQTLAVSYMTQDAMVSIVAPFITTSLALNGDISQNVVITPGSTQSISLSYTNTLATPVTNVAVSVLVSGSGIDYNSIKTTNGFYNSSNHTIAFGQDVDPALASLAPGASGLGTFTFTTLPAGGSSPTVTFTVSVSGMRVGESDVPEQVTTSAVKTAKIATAVQFSSASSHTMDASSSGPIPPRVNQATTYSVIWRVQNQGSAIAGGSVTATLPGYMSYTGATSGAGSFTYNGVSHTVTWATGDIPQGGSAQGAFQVSLTPSISQKGGMVILANQASFVGHDRFAGIAVTAQADQVTTETKNDPGYTSASAIVQ